MTLYLGFSSIHFRTLANDPSDLPAYIDLLISPTWPKQPYRLSLIQGPAARRPGRLKKSELVAVVREMLLHPDVDEVGLEQSTSEFQFGNAIYAYTREYGGHPTIAFGRHLVPEAPSTLEPWVDHIVTFFDRTRTPQAVVFALPMSACLMEGAFGEVVSEGVVQHPWPEQFARMQRAKRDGLLGTKYVRYPRWGTLYSREQVAAIGGVAAIERAVKPAVIRELGGGVYVQLTASVATAASAEAAAKQEAFTALMAPLLPPPVA